MCETTTRRRRLYVNAVMAFVEMQKRQTSSLRPHMSISVDIRDSSARVARRKRNYQVKHHLHFCKHLIELMCGWNASAGAWLLPVTSEICRTFILVWQREQCAAGQSPDAIYAPVLYSKTSWAGSKLPSILACELELWRVC